MAIDIAYKASVDTASATTSVKSLKQQFAEAEDALFAMAGAGKENTAEFRKASIEAAKLKERVDDINESLDALKPEAKLSAFSDIAGGVAGGFAAAAGAAALFGGESEELQKTLVKVQAAMAFQQGLAGLKNLGDGFKNLRTIMSQTVIGQKILTAAQWLWNAAMSANPIGAIIAGIVALIAVMKLLVDAQDDEAEALERTNELRKEALELREKDIALIKRKQDALQRASDFELNLAKAQGKSSDELYQLEKDNIDKRISDLIVLANLRDSGMNTVEESKELTKLYHQRRILAAQNEVKEKQEAEKLAAIRKSASEKRIAQQKKDNDKIKADAQKLADELFKIEQDLIAQRDANDAAELAASKALIDKVANDKDKSLEDDRDRAKVALEIEFEKTDRSAEAYQALVDGKALIDADYRTQKDEAEKVARIKTAAAEQEALDKRFEHAKNAVDGLQGLADSLFTLKMSTLKKGSAEELRVAKKQFEINKALAISATTISTIQGVMNALSAKSVIPEPFGQAFKIANAVGVGLAGAANVAKIASTKFEGGGSAVGSLPSTAGTSAPSINAPQNSNTQLNPDGTVNSGASKGTPVVKAYVVETEMTGTQNSVRQQEQQAKIQ